MPAKQSLLGRWFLVAYESPSASGRLVRMTEGQVGILEYGENGRMRVEIDRDLAQLQILDLNPRLVHLHYGGRYEIESEASLVRHHVEEADDPNRVGQILVRHFQLEGDQLEQDSRLPPSRHELPGGDRCRTPPLFHRGRRETVHRGLDFFWLRQSVRLPLPRGRFKLLGKRRVP